MGLTKLEKASIALGIIAVSAVSLYAFRMQLFNLVNDTLLNHIDMNMTYGELYKNKKIIFIL